MNIINDHFVLPYKKFFQYFYYVVATYCVRGRFPLGIKKQPVEKTPNTDSFLVGMLFHLRFVKNIYWLDLWVYYFANFVGFCAHVFVCVYFGLLCERCDYNDKGSICRIIIASQLSLHVGFSIFPYLACRLFKYHTFVLGSNAYSRRGYVFLPIYLFIWLVQDYITTFSMIIYLLLLLIKEMGDCLLFIEHITLTWSFK